MSDPYEEAGSIVEEEEDQISLVKYSYLLNDEVATILEEVLEENPLPFELADFQRLAIHALGSLQNVILISPTGSGKMMVVYLAILVLQKKFGIHSGVGVGTQPLSSIMKEKLKTALIPTGTISMRGSVQTSTSLEEEEEEVSLSVSLDDMMTGMVSCLIGHAESWLSKTAKEILDSLQDLGLILLSFVDEAHVTLKDHWDSFRPQMRQVPGQLRGRAVRSAPCLAMTATLAPEEVNQLMETLGLRSENTVVLQGNPIQQHFKFIRKERPPNIYGSYGKDDKPGLVEVLGTTFLDKYVESIRAGVPVKKSIWFFKKEEDIADVNDHLCEQLPEFCKDPSKCPWVVNFSSIGPVTASSIRDREGEISLYLSTAVMLMGIDLSNIQIVGMVRPFENLHSLVQACGRGGRRTGAKGRQKVVFFLLYNKSDIAENTDTSKEVREFCLTKDCLKKFLMNYFGSSGKIGGEWCCSNCDAKKM